MLSAVLSLLVLATIALTLGAVVLWRRGVRKQALLMLVLAAIAVVNIAIWTLPGADGAAPVDRVPGREAP
ncbi:hypothetical protein F7D01_04150 [Erythrobacter sp. 3-20A1M]|uniref:hypothetical protein n=1 Tax=Erythrobacter sp. 3-20A1M TaxID=2653850 RepID=UPI001BFCA95A|nr:hypothetical protein [Erythrobacter sp. 3-20A1M]QWC56389.1 hypothetical protein F7D01_04150 [Erythrobacter sp. 3-20A1M]